MYNTTDLDLQPGCNPVDLLYKQMGELKKIQEILSKIGTEFFKIDEEMTEKNEAEDGNSISLKSPWHMKWDRQQSLPFFICCLMS